MSAKKYEQSQSGYKEIFSKNFVGGIAFGLGATLGISILLWFIGLISEYVGLIPIVGNFVLGVLEFIEQNSK